MDDAKKLECTITASANSESDLEFALEEALRVIKRGATSGFDSNDDSEFSFHIKRN